VKKMNTESESEGDEVEDERGEDESKEASRKILQTSFLKGRKIVLIKI